MSPIVVRVVGAAVLALTVLGLGLYALYRIETEAAYERLRGRSSLVASPLGDIEYAVGGDGPVVLVVHGSAGGFDQGELIARTLLGERFRWIAPSRFGYLRSSLPADASWERQADAYAHLLDALGVARVAVVALSQGGPSALAFAARHPERVSSLTLLSCRTAPASAAIASDAEAGARGDALTRLFAHDVLYWAVAKAFRGTLLDLMGGGAVAPAELPAERRALAERIVEIMNPASPRHDGVVFDNHAPVSADALGSIIAPTLIVHASDDTLQPFRNATLAASAIAGSTLLRFDHGGHLLLAVERDAIAARVRDHLTAPGDERVAPPAAASPGAR